MKKTLKEEYSEDTQGKVSWDDSYLKEWINKKLEETLLPHGFLHVESGNWSLLDFNVDEYGSQTPNPTPLSSDEFVDQWERIQGIEFHKPPMGIVFNLDRMGDSPLESVYSDANIRGIGKGVRGHRALVREFRDMEDTYFTREWQSLQQLEEGFSAWLKLCERRSACVSLDKIPVKVYRRTLTISPQIESIV